MTQLQERLRADLTAALRGRDRGMVRVLRSALAAIANAEAQPIGAAPAASAAELSPRVGEGEVARRELSVEEVRAVLVGECDERVAAADVLDRAGSHEAAEELRHEAHALEEYLTG